MRARPGKFHTFFTSLLLLRDNVTWASVMVQAMKANFGLLKSLSPLSSMVAAVTLVTAAPALAPAAQYVAHEWRTFTYVEGADGVQLGWRPLETSKLPGFVHNWRDPGCGRQASGSALGVVFGKGVITTLQRMETPVIYFYSDRQQSVDVQVDFPKGILTEWFPQAAQIGPSVIAPVPAAVAKLDTAAHHVGAKPTFTFESLLNNHAVSQSRARWTGVEILAPNQTSKIAKSLLQDGSGSHYFAARETDANYVQLNSLSPTNPAPEREKFLFYRGVGNFATPLQVTQGSGDTITVANDGEEALAHLFVLGLRNGQGEFVEIGKLPPGEKRTVEPKWQEKTVRP